MGKDKNNKLRQELLALADLGRESVVGPEWGGRSFDVQALSLADASAVHAALREFRDEKSGELPRGFWAAAWVAATLHEPDGGLVFSLDDIPALAGKSAAALERIYAVADRLNLLSGEARHAEKQNFTATATPSSSTGSPAN